ncbi:MAG: type II/IV secretion system ATPase subunit [Dehalococcoidia bacterium]|nr:MAG: type II/IV secretion system ATPase subunit [Dehalococcoidia bacterium]
MARILLPFEKKEAERVHRRNPDEHDDLYRLLPEGLQAACQENRHLWDYLCLLPLDEISVPAYYNELERSMGDWKEFNLIYPVGDGLFVHLYTGSGEGRPNYIPIEPGLTEDLGDLLPAVEQRMSGVSSKLNEAESEEERADALVSLIDKICVERQNGSRGSFSSKKGTVEKGKKSGRSDRVQVTAQQLKALKYVMVRDKVGMSVMEPMLHDRYIEDINCSGVGHVFLEHKIFKAVKSAVTFENHEDLDSYVLRLSEAIKIPVTLRSPIVDSTLPDGSRINIVFGREVSRRGSNFTIRKFGGTPLSILDLVSFGSLNYEMAAYLSIVIGEGMNMFVVGEAASGKTSLLNAVTAFIPLKHKIVSIEDTPELQVPHANWLREVAKATAPGEQKANVDMFDLLKAALRQRPNVIIVGEIRGEEGTVAFNAMQTGHEVMSTFHASSVEKLIQRLTGYPINVPKTYMDNLNVVVCQNNVKLTGGETARRTTSISEIVGYDTVSNLFSYVDVFRWDPVTDNFEFIGKRNSYLLEEKIAMMMGIPADEKWRIYNVVERRARILEKLHKDRGVTDFYELLNVLATAQEQGVY